MAYPYEQICETGDRGWSRRLLARVPVVGLSEAEDEQLVRALAALSDPRSVRPLVALLEDRTEDAVVRERASRILCRLDWSNDPSTEQLMAWWTGSDDLLRRHALSCMWGGHCAEIVARAAADSTHPLQALAIDRMVFCFAAPEVEAIKIQALGHPAAEVRCAAASALLWDEPVGAELPLLGALRDADVSVVAAALATLRYYPTRRVFGAIGDLRTSCPEELTMDVEEAYQDLRASFLAPLLSESQRVREHVSRWLEPISHLLAFTPEELEPDSDRLESVAAVVHREPRSLGWISRRLTDPDTSTSELQALFRDTEWAGCATSDRAALRALLLGHEDMLVRDASADIFWRWGDLDALTTLLDDGTYLVRKSAMYALGQLPADPKIADVAWEYLRQRRIRGTHAAEALTCHLHHAPGQEAMARMFELASSPAEPENLRARAISYLAERGALRELELALPRLSEPPTVTWAFHLALLDAAAQHRLTVPDLAALAEVDNLDIQRALGGLFASPPGTLVRPE